MCSNGENELGFRSFYQNTMGIDGDGLTEGDAFGIIGDTSTPQGGGGGGAAPHGAQYYMMEDTDGYAFAMLDAVGIAGTRNATLSFWLKVAATTWEYTDLIRISVDDEDPAGARARLRSLDIAPLETSRS